MAASSTKTSLIKVILFVCLIIFALLIAVFAFTQLRQNHGLPLNPGTFVSAVEPRWLTRPDGTKITYYVLNTSNKSSQDFFACQISLISKGTLREYFGFVTDYTEPDCRAIADPRSHYNCRIQNWLHRLQRYSQSQTIERVAANSSFPIPLSRFYTHEPDRVAQTDDSYSFAARQRLTDIHRVKIFCKTASGEKVNHTQTLPD